jgi:hypothetical protein
MSALATHDPAVAIAMGHCAMARTRDPEHRVTRFHAAECGWCVYPAAELRTAIAEFNAWAEYDDRRRTTGRHATRTFADLTPAQREARIAEAQALGAVPWHIPPPENPEPEAEHPPAHVEEEEVVVPWLTR